MRTVPNWFTDPQKIGFKNKTQDYFEYFIINPF